MPVVLFLLWLLLTGSLSPRSLLLGAALSLALAALFRPLRAKEAHSRFSLRRVLLLLRYLLYLLGQIVLSAAQVTALIWSGKPREPRMVHFTPPLQSDSTRVLLANSITLTPGTITVEIEHGEFRVHALDASMAEGLAECGFVRRLTALEKVEETQ